MSDYLQATGSGYDFGMFEALPRDAQGLPKAPSRQSEKEIKLVRAERKKLADYKAKVTKVIFITAIVAFCFILILAGNIKVKQADRILRIENEVNDKLRVDAISVQEQLAKQVTHEELMAFVERRGMRQPLESQKHYFFFNENNEGPAYINRVTD